MALHHRQRLLHARLFCATKTGSKSGLLVSVRNLLRVPSEMLALSNFCSFSRKSTCIMTCFALVQSVFSPNRTQIASRTMTTMSGGFGKPLISEISPLLSLESASSASLSTGTALSSSDCASSAIIFISEAYALTIWASSLTNRSFWFASA